MGKSKTRGLREQAKKWTCNHFSITNHRGDAAKLLRKAADAIEQLEEITVLDIVFHSPAEPSFKEITVSVYFPFAPSLESVCRKGVRQFRVLLFDPA